MSDPEQVMHGRFTTVTQKVELHVGAKLGDKGVHFEASWSFETIDAYTIRLTLRCVSDSGGSQSGGGAIRRH